MLRLAIDTDTSVSLEAAPSPSDINSSMTSGRMVLPTEAKRNSIVTPSVGIVYRQVSSDY